MYRTPDPGSRRAALIAKLVAIPLLVVVVAMQQASIYLAPMLEERSGPAVEAPGMDDQGLLVARIFLKVARAWPAIGGQGEPLRSLDSLWQDEAATPTGAEPNDWRAAMDARVNELRAALIAGESAGATAAVERLAELRERLVHDSTALATLGSVEEDRDEPEELERATQVIGVLHADVELFTRHFQVVGEQEATAEDSAPGEASGADPAIDEAAWDALIERHGWFAELARVSGRPAGDPDRAALLAGGRALLGLILLLCTILVVVAIGGLSASIWLIVMLATRRLRFWFVPPLTGGSVYLEVVAAFILAFLGTQVMAVGLGAVPALADYMVEVALAIQWLVLIVVFWPLLRGVSLNQWRRDLGLIAPRGLLREIGAGFVGYLAGLPLLVAAGVLGVVLKQLQDTLFKDQIPYTTGGNPVLEMISDGGVWQIVLLVTLATVWAPLVEEVVFRGCLFRHLRGRLGFLLAAPLSALAFGLMHQYELVLLGPVLALGVTFAFIREWRGSLIGAIVMHALHNGTLMFFFISIVRLSE